MSAPYRVTKLLQEALDHVDAQASRIRQLERLLVEEHEKLIRAQRENNLLRRITERER